MEFVQILCTRFILPCKNSSLLYSCCIKWPFSYLVRMVALHLNNSTTKAYLYNKVVQLPFLSRLTNHTLNMADKHGITLIPAYIPTHLNVETDYTS